MPARADRSGCGVSADIRLSFHDDWSVAKESAQHESADTEAQEPHQDRANPEVGVRFCNVGPDQKQAQHDRGRRPGPSGMIGKTQVQ